MPRTAFVSGPIEPPQGYFKLHYEQRIVDAINAGDSFVLGPAPGMDTEALEFLCSRPDVDKGRITLHLTENEDKMWRGRYAEFEQVGGKVRVAGITTGQRDEACTETSDYDILRYMPVAEAKAYYGAAWFPKISQTEHNEMRRIRKDDGVPPSLFPRVEKEGLLEKVRGLLRRK